MVGQNKKALSSTIVAGSVGMFAETSGGTSWEHRQLERRDS
jgi:hypothetical protein